MFTVLKTKCLIINHQTSKVLGIYCDILWYILGFNEEVLQVFFTEILQSASAALCKIYKISISIYLYLHESLSVLFHTSKFRIFVIPLPSKKTPHASINQKSNALSSCSALKVFYQLILRCECIMWCENIQNLSCLHSKSNTNWSSFLTDMHAKKTCLPTAQCQWWYSKICVGRKWEWKI